MGWGRNDQPKFAWPEANKNEGTEKQKKDFNQHDLAVSPAKIGFRPVKKQTLWCKMIQTMQGMSTWPKQTGGPVHCFEPHGELHRDASIRARLV